METYGADFLTPSFVIYVSKHHYYHHHHHPPGGGVSIDFTNMQGVLELNEHDLDIRVQGGLGYIELNDFLRPKGARIYPYYISKHHLLE
jgi:FAD/FMN-containing dehydrogenase